MNPTQQGSSDTTTTTTTTQPASNVTNSHNDGGAVIEIKKEVKHLEEIEIKEEEVEEIEIKEEEVEEVEAEEVGRTTRTTGKRSSSNSHSCQAVPNTNKLWPHTQEMHQHSPEEGKSCTFIFFSRSP